MTAACESPTTPRLGAKRWTSRAFTAAWCASQGSYGLAGQMGSAAVSNQMQPGNQLLGANQGAAGTIMQGQGQRIQGLGSVLNSQTSMAGQAAASGDATMGAIGSVAGLAGAVVI